LIFEGDYGSEDMARKLFIGLQSCEKEATTPLVFRSSLFKVLSVKQRPFSVRYPTQLMGVSLRPTNEKKTVFLTEITHLTVSDVMRKTTF